MTQGHNILVVAHTTALASTLVSWLGQLDHELVLVNSFAGGKRELTGKPDLLITEIKLGEYNGLHLALRGQSAGIPVIVLGPVDAVFAHEAEQLGATYLPWSGLEFAELHGVLDQLVDATAGPFEADTETPHAAELSELPGWLPDRSFMLH